MRLWGRCVVLAAILAWMAGPALAQSETFEDWLGAFRAEARGQGIGEATLARALDGLEPIPRVIELDRRQPSARLSWATYRERVLSDERVARGRELYREHRELLARVARDYGVQARFIVALWGVESTYGAFRGQFPVVGALATLAWEGRRASLFRRELLNALRILEAGDVGEEQMIGSWAGAMGQSQFLPSSYLDFAVDYDGDGRRDIWTSLPDIFASIANYLARAGWNDRYTWGREVQAPAALENGTLGLEVKKPLPRWQQLGVRRANGRNLPPVAIEASLLRMDDGEGPAYLVYNNFRVLMVWNRSTYFALSVGELADLIAAG
jgi:membrane-bound lytic murein transglycosylase B